MGRRGSNGAEEANSHTAETLEARARSLDSILRTKGTQPNSKQRSNVIIHFSFSKITTQKRVRSEAGTRDCESNQEKEIMRP